jgi:hypothetical protein
LPSIRHGSQAASHSINQSIDIFVPIFKYDRVLPSNLHFDATGFVDSPQERPIRVDQENADAVDLGCQLIQSLIELGPRRLKSSAIEFQVLRLKNEFHGSLSRVHGKLVDSL